jgi:hypothetical protein
MVPNKLFSFSDDQPDKEKTLGALIERFEKLTETNSSS